MANSAEASPLVTLENLRLNMAQMDDLILSMARRAIRLCTRTNTADTCSCPVHEEDLQTIIRSRVSLSEAVTTMIEYLLKLPESYSFWQAVSRAIYDLYGTSHDGAPTHSWELWKSHVYDLGRRVMASSVNAAVAIRDLDDGQARCINNITDRLRQVDELLALLPGDPKENLSDDLQDTLLASIEIGRRGIELNMDTVRLFKSELRARRRVISTQHQVEVPIPPQQSADSSQAKSAPDPNDVWKPTTLATTLILTLISFALLIQGWQASSHEPGTSRDADFWFLLQSETMQLASIIPLVLGFCTNPIQSRQVSWWIWILIGISVLCTILSPILYLVVPVEYSSMIGFFGSAALVFVVLEAMFIPSLKKEKSA